MQLGVWVMSLERTESEEIPEMWITHEAELDGSTMYN